MIGLFVLCALAAQAAVLAKPAEIRIRRDVHQGVVAFPDSPAATLQRDQPILSEAPDDTGFEREQREAVDYEDYGNDEDGPEGRHLKLHKLKRKFKPHKHGHGGLLGGHGGYGGHGGLLGGHGGYGGHGGLLGGHGCRKLHGCGGGHGGYGGWQQPSYGGYGGPVASAFAGVGPGYGGWGGPGYGGYGQTPGAQAQVATWNLGPFQGTFGLAQAG